jgi:hypothetical protein
MPHTYSNIPQLKTTTTTTNPLPSNGYVLKTRTFHDKIKDNFTEI